MKFKFQLEDWQKHFFVFAGLFFLIVFFIVPERSHEGDTICWMRWIAHIKTHGFTNVYDTDTEYLPAFQYLLFLFSLIKYSIEDVSANMQYFKLIIFLFHLASSYFVFLSIKRWAPENYLKYGAFYLLNIAVLHNTLVWGQVDEIISFFAIASIYFLLRENSLMGLIFFLLALNFKYQSVVFLPVILFLIIPLYLSQSLKKFVRDIFLALGLQLLIFLPFIAAGKLPLIMRVIANLVDSQPFISANAYNLWFAMIGKEARWMNDSEVFVVFSYKQWGLGLFFIFSFITLLPLFIFQMKKIWKRSKVKLNPQLAILTSGVLPFVFFFFCTQMHERYGHSAVIFLVVYSILSKRWYIGFFASLAYLLNIDGVLRSISFQNYGVLLFNPKLIAIIFLLTIILSLRDIYKIAFAERVFDFRGKF